MYFVIGAKDHGPYVAGGLESAAHKVERLPGMHSYVPHVPVASGVWGHTFRVGGPFPGGPFLLAQRPRGGLRRIPGRRSAAHDLALRRRRLLHPRPPARVYTLVMTAKNHSVPVPATVTVREGRPVAAGVYDQMSQPRAVLGDVGAGGQNLCRALLATNGAPHSPSCAPVDLPGAVC